MRWKDEWYILNMILVFTEVLVCSFVARESMWNRMKYGTVSPLYLHPVTETEPRSNKSRFTTSPYYLAILQGRMIQTS
jgi:hypothetical protein